MAYIVMAYIVTAYTFMAYIVMAYIVMAYIAMAYVVMAYIVMAYVAMAYIVMALGAAAPAPRSCDGVHDAVDGGEVVVGASQANLLERVVVLVHDDVDHRLRRRRAKHHVGKALRKAKRHNYIGHNYIGHNYVGHKHIGHNHIAQHHVETNCGLDVWVDVWAYG